MKSLYLWSREVVLTEQELHGGTVVSWFRCYHALQWPLLLVIIPIDMG